MNRLRDENVATRVIYMEGRIRENLGILTPDGTMTRIIRKSPKIKHHTIDELETALSEEIRPTTLVVVAGVMPDGITDEIFVRDSRVYQGVRRRESLRLIRNLRRW